MHTIRPHPSCGQYNVHVRSQGDCTYFATTTSVADFVWFGVVQQLRTTSLSQTSRTKPHTITKHLDDAAKSANGPHEFAYIVNIFQHKSVQKHIGLMLFGCQTAYTRLSICFKYCIWYWF